LKKQNISPVMGKTELYLPKLALLSFSFLIGLVAAGVLYIRFPHIPEGWDWLYLLSEQVPDHLTTPQKLFYAVRYIGLILLFGFSPLGIVGIPFTLTVRGFGLAWSVCTIGPQNAYASFGASSMVSLAFMLILSVQGFSVASNLFRKTVFRQTVNSRIPALQKRFFCCFLAALAAVSLTVIYEDSILIWINDIL